MYIHIYNFYIVYISMTNAKSQKGSEISRVLSS